MNHYTRVLTQFSSLADHFVRHDRIHCGNEQIRGLKTSNEIEVIVLGVGGHRSECSGELMTSKICTSRPIAKAHENRSVSNLLPVLPSLKRRQNRTCVRLIFKR